jgi:hypothetical protein
VNRSILALALAATIMTAACGGGATAAPPAGSSSPATSPAAGTANPSSAGGEPSAAGSGDAAALCAFLKSEIPALQQAGSTGGAIAQLAIDYANWIEADSSRVLPDAATIDVLTKASCPEVRADVLKFLGEDSFANSL